jgi:hypothetical protein
MRGPLLSGPLGSASTLDAVSRRLDGVGGVVVIGPLWLGVVLSARVRVLLLTEAEERQRARRAIKRARTAGQRLTVGVAGVDLPLAAGAVEALLIESPSTLDGEAMARWLATLVPVLRPGGLLIALDATDNPAVEARLAGLFLGSALLQIAQERPREGVILTVGRAPEASVIAARFADVGRSGATGMATSAG